ncbi:telomerase RNA component interacting RNase [Pleuronectes platessa]|uniref:telomerase RNA component interacting RNase n=1 Tax=Pleuronectes platessa TaxID=8262 RepID=UPI00232A4372|nr:telomerase RNA component interacting RNase [Pleuronectes platessa]
MDPNRRPRLQRRPATKPRRPGGNAFANDGSFMEMFKKKMEAEERRKRSSKQQEEQQQETPELQNRGQTPVDKKPPAVTSFRTHNVEASSPSLAARLRAPVTVSVFYPLTQVGKRRGGVFLKTGMVAKKQKDDSEAVPGKSDAWASYMAEVKKYKAHQCGDDDKTRPLVK